MRKFWMLALLVCFGAPLRAEVLYCRSGSILGAEYSTRRVLIENFKPGVTKTDFPSKVYAMVYLKPDRNRAVSIHDYDLDFNGRNYPCAAVRCGDGIFDAEKFLIAPEHHRPGEICTLLFVLDASRMGYSNEGLLISKYPPQGVFRTSIAFQNLKDGPFTRASTIPAEGLFK